MNASSAVLTSRCSYLTPEGRQCRLLSSDPRSGLCSHHLSKKKDPADLTHFLLANSQGFQTAQGINFTLSNLYKLLAANHISPRRASVLAFISSLLLRTLPAIDADRAAGITDPTRKESAPIAEPAAKEVTTNKRAQAAEGNSQRTALVTDQHLAPGKTGGATLVHSPLPASAAPNSVQTAPPLSQSAPKPAPLASNPAHLPQSAPNPAPLVSAAAHLPAMVGLSAPFNPPNPSTVSQPAPAGNLATFEPSLISAGRAEARRRRAADLCYAMPKNATAK